MYPMGDYGNVNFQNDIWEANDVENLAKKVKDYLKSNDFEKDVSIDSVVDNQKVICIKEIEFNDTKFEVGDIVDNDLDIFQIRSININEYFQTLSSLREQRIDDILNDE